MNLQVAQQTTTVEMITSASVELGKVTKNIEHTDIDLVLKNGDVLLLSCGDKAVIVDNSKVFMEQDYELCGFVFEGTEAECGEVVDFLNRTIAQCIQAATS